MHISEGQGRSITYLLNKTNQYSVRIDPHCEDRRIAVRGLLGEFRRDFRGWKPPKILGRPLQYCRN